MEQFNIQLIFKYPYIILNMYMLTDILDIIELNFMSFLIEE